MDIKVLSAILRHAQASTTLNRYGHALPDYKAESMKKMRVNYVGRHGGPEGEHPKAMLPGKMRAAALGKGKLILFKLHAAGRARI